MFIFSFNLKDFNFIFNFLGLQLMEKYTSNSIETFNDYPIEVTNEYPNDMNPTVSQNHKHDTNVTSVKSSTCIIL